MFNEIITNEAMKFNELEKNIYKFVCNLGCQIMKMYLEKQDEKLMKTRDKEKYRHKGKRKNTVKTLMGEVEYERTMYVEKENEEIKYTYLLDESMELTPIGKMSENLTDTLVDVVVNSTSYRKAEENIKNLTNESISHEGIRNVVLKLGEKVTKRENEEVKHYEKNELIEGTKEIAALFEETDGIWINLQGKDRKKALERNQEECTKKGKKFNKKMKIKTELKMHLMYEGWEKDSSRHELINKQYIAGIMKSSEIKKLRDARVYQKYKKDKIELRVVNGDGAKWTKGIVCKGGIYQKDYFHIRQEIVRDVPKEYRYMIEDLLESKEYSKIPKTIEFLKYEVGGEEKAVKKLDTLKSYLSTGLERYQDILKKQGKKLPDAPKGIEYRNLGTQESQIFSLLKVRFCSGRKSFSLHGANALAKICVIAKDKCFKIGDLKKTIPLDTSVTEWINAIESKISKKYRDVGISRNYENMSNCKAVSLDSAPAFLKEMLQEIEFTSMKCSY